MRTERTDEMCCHQDGIFFREGLFHASVDGYATVFTLIGGRIAHISHPKNQVDLDVRRHLVLSSDEAHSRSTGNYTGNQKKKLHNVVSAGMLQSAQLYYVEK